VSGRPPSPQDAAEILDLYKFSVEMADRISSRRGTANAFFLTLHTGLATFLGIVRPDAASGAGGVRVDDFSLIFTAVIGIVLAATWWLLLRSYRDLNSAKFKVILEMEERLPVKPFAEEWRHLKSDPVKRKGLARYAELNLVERIVPVVFALVYVAAALRVWVS
jgi:hypothetical protein